MRTSTESNNQHSGAPSGQVIIMFALFLTAMIGMVGLATDVGYAMSQKRTVQNAADAAALAGARQVAKWRADAPTSAWAEVNLFATKDENRIASTSQTVEECAYVNDASADVDTNCANLVPASATGVRVMVREEHSTFFIHVLPGAPNTVTSTASAIAHVQLLTSPPTDGPFLVCGVKTKLAGTGTMDIMIRTGGSWTFNSNAHNQTFQIHGPQTETCKAKASRYKGFADTVANRTRTAPNWFKYTEGTSAGQIWADVQGVQGCKAGQPIVNCVAFLPIVVDDPPEDGNDRQLWTVAFAPFYITQPKSNEHEGRLLLDYVVGGEGEWGWQRGTGGILVIRLTG